MAAHAPLHDPPLVLKLLAHEVRWHLVQVLVRSDYRVHELVALVQKPMNLVSYHLRLLRDVALLTERRSAADGRDVYYHLDVERLQTLYLDAGHAVVPTLPAADPVPRDADAPPTAPPTRILFLCTHNSARSQMAEAITRHVGRAAVAVASAGTEPAQVHPLALAVLADKQIATDALVSKHVDTLADQTFDYVITVCDRAREACPTFPGHPEMLHWSFPDPSAVPGSALERRQAFETTAQQLMTRIRFLMTILERAQRDQTRERTDV